MKYSDFVAPAMLGLVLSLAGSVLAQNSSRIYGYNLDGTPRYLTLDDSWTRPRPVPVRQIRLHDIVSIRVDELARMQADGEVERRKNMSFNSVLLNWLTLNGFRQAINDPQTNGDQQIQGTLDQLIRSENEIGSSERLTFNIAARVVDIRPNGNIVLEAHKEVRNNNEIWRASLTGICRQDDIGLDNVILTRHLVDLRIHKYESGHVRDSVRRGWLTKLLDRFSPF